jgi:hypothetical protein
MKIGLIAIAAVAMISSGGATHALDAQGEAFVKSCAGCHARADALAKKLKGATLEERRLELDAFLKSHHTKDEAMRAAIVDYLTLLSSP